jgi:hypothetical protein
MFVVQLMAVLLARAFPSVTCPLLGRPCAAVHQSASCSLAKQHPAATVLLLCCRGLPLMLSLRMAGKHGCRRH